MQPRLLSFSTVSCFRRSKPVLPWVTCVFSRRHQRRRAKKDIVVADKPARWSGMRNPTWKRHTIIEGQTKPDNVSIAAYDIDGDGPA